MCCNNPAFLKALQNCGHVVDDHDRREMAELRKAARRVVVARSINQVGRLWRAVLKLWHRHNRDQVAPR